MTLGLAVQCGDQIQQLRRRTLSKLSYLSYQVYFIQLFTADTMVIFTSKRQFTWENVKITYDSSGGTNSYM